MRTSSEDYGCNGDYGSSEDYVQRMCLAHLVVKPLTGMHNFTLLLRLVGMAPILGSFSSSWVTLNHERFFLCRPDAF